MVVRKLHSLDLFTGIGGLTLALHDYASPVAYCDIMPAARTCIAHNISRGALPPAPIVEDVRSLTAGQGVLQHQRVRGSGVKGGAVALPAAPSARSAASQKKRARVRQVDMIVAGFPCVGFSVAGKHEGFQNDQSSLFSEVLRLTDELQVHAVFLENVPLVLKHGMYHISHELGVKRGFRLWWCVLSAYDLGAPQRRRRWYCLAVRDNGVLGKLCQLHRAAASAAKQPSAMHAWARPFPPGQRMASDEELERMALHPRERIKLLGNSVVPDAARHAMRALLMSASASASKSASAKVHPSFAHLPGAHDRNDWALVTRETRFPYHGALALTPRRRMQLRVDLHPAVPLRTTNFQGITMVPGVYQTPPWWTPPASMRRELLTKPMHKDTWATPRANVSSVSHVLTERTNMDLGTQVRFERDTPDAIRMRNHLSPRFVEWMMGFPRDWTSGGSSAPGSL
jgi:site-specific DNA-cytosine methylase